MEINSNKFFPDRIRLYYNVETRCRTEVGIPSSRNFEFCRLRRDQNPTYVGCMYVNMLSFCRRCSDESQTSIQRNIDAMCLPGLHLYDYQIADSMYSTMGS